MTMIVEDGSIVAGANSYATVEFADEYNTARGHDEWLPLSNAKKESALICATDYIESIYGRRFEGYKVSTTQSLSFPRTFVYEESSNYVVPSNVVPLFILRSTVYLALISSKGKDLLEPQGARVTSEKVGDIEVKYDTKQTAITRYPFVDAMLEEYINGNEGMIDNSQKKIYSSLSLKAVRV